MGSPDTVTAAIRKQHELIGYDILLTQHNITSMPDDMVTASRRLFGAAVIPALQSPAVTAR